MSYGTGTAQSIPAADSKFTIDAYPDNPAQADQITEINNAIAKLKKKLPGAETFINSNGVNKFAAGHDDTSWTAADSGNEVLFYDPTDSGVLAGPVQMFGNQFINASDAAFAEIKIQQDDGTVIQLADAGISLISLAYTASGTRDENGNVQVSTATITRIMGLDQIGNWQDFYNNFEQLNPQYGTIMDSAVFQRILVDGTQISTSLASYDCGLESIAIEGGPEARLCDSHGLSVLYAGAENETFFDNDLQDLIVVGTGNLMDHSRTGAETLVWNQRDGSVFVYESNGDGYVSFVVQS